MLRPCLLFLSFAVVGFAGCNQHPVSPTPPQKPAITAGEIGSRLPDFSVKDLQGHLLSSSDFAGRLCLPTSGLRGASRAKKRCRATRSSQTAMALAAL